MLNQLKIAINTIKTKKPLVLNLTNLVTMDFMANALLALGGAPIMSISRNEFEPLIHIASCLNINIGTLTPESVDDYIFAAKIAKLKQKPIILDPVGAGASDLRTNAAINLLTYCDIVRGNASEILALAQISNSTQGVESIHQTQQAKEAAIQIAKQYNCIVVISGETDLITDGIKTTIHTFGSNLMPLVTGMGCTLTAVIALFTQTSLTHFEAAECACIFYSLCGEMAEKQSPKPGNFKSAFIDVLYSPDWDFIASRYVI